MRDEVTCRMEILESIVGQKRIVTIDFCESESASFYEVSHRSTAEYMTLGDAGYEGTEVLDMFRTQNAELAYVIAAQFMQDGVKERTDTLI